MNTQTYHSLAHACHLSAACANQKHFIEDEVDHHRNDAHDLVLCAERKTLGALSDFFKKCAELKMTGEQAASLWNLLTK